MDTAIDLPSLQAILRLTSPLSVLHLNNLVWIDHHQQFDPTSPLSITSYQNSVTRLSVYNVTPDDNYSPLELLSLFNRITVLSLKQSLTSCGSGTFTWISNVRIRHLILNMNYIAVDSMCDCTPSSLERLDVTGLEQTKWHFLVLLTQASARTLETLRLVVSNGDGSDLNMIDSGESMISVFRSLTTLILYRSIDNLYWPPLPILQDVTLLPGLFSNGFFNAILRSLPRHITTIRIVDFCNPTMAPETYLRQTSWMTILRQLIRIRSWSTLDLLLVLTSTLGSTPLPDLVAHLFDVRTRANLGKHINATLYYYNHSHALRLGIDITLREMDANDAFSLHMLDDDTDDTMSDVSDVDLDVLL